jgi:hypothetical protein
MAYNPLVRKELWSLPIDFFARRTHFIDHLAPIWKELDSRIKGKFYVPGHLYDYARSQNLDGVYSLSPMGYRKQMTLNVRPLGKGPLVTCAYGDMEMGWHGYALRPFILMEHGVGLSFETHPGYGGGQGLRRNVSLFLAPNQNIFDKTYKTYPTAPQVIIGTPKMDTIICQYPETINDPVIGISFHWNGKAVCPEAGNALDYYMDILPELAKNYHIVGHGHPKIMHKLTPMYKGCGITDIEGDFERVMSRCDIYINDASSTLYEFTCTGKPVIILNAPWFRKTVHWGIRFWDYTDIGVQVDEPEQLIPAIERTIANPSEFCEQRRKAIDELYPYLGQSAQRAAQAITTFIRSKKDGTAFNFE